MIAEACEAKDPVVRISRLLGYLGIASSSWYAQPKAHPQRPGRKPKGVPEEIGARIRALAEMYPWWGYKRIAVVARREGLKVANKQVYRVLLSPDLSHRVFLAVFCDSRASRFRNGSPGNAMWDGGVMGDEPGRAGACMAHAPPAVIQNGRSSGPSRWPCMGSGW
jgi:hypothetical protein